MMPSGVDEFWVRLAWWVTGVMASSRDNNIRFLWVDDFWTKRYVPPPRELTAGEILLRADVSEDSGTSFVSYRVRLLMSDESVAMCLAGEWDRLLPAPARPHLIKVSRANKHIEIDLSSPVIEAESR